jgi:hypothetical protein
MRKHDDEYEMGKVIADPEYDSDIIDLSTFTNVSNIGNRRNGFRTGTLDRPERMEEGEDVGSVEDQNDEQVRNAAMEEFANKIKTAVSAKLMGKKLNLKLKGHKDLVSQITNMIKLETDYLNALMMGQAADTPALQKNKAIIDTEAKKLDRMLGVNDFWPFK